MSKIFLIIYSTTVIISSAYSDHRVHYGEAAQQGEYPFMASIRSSEKIAKNGTDYHHFCGAFIITPYYSLTAAHCVNFQKGYKPMPTCVYRLYVGSTSLADSKQIGKPKMYELSKIILHYDYNPKNNTDDIALLKTKTKMEFSESVMCISLPPFDFSIPYGSEVDIMGWGYDQHKTAPELMQKTKGTAYEIESTRIYMKGTIGTLNKRSKIDFGDSGSPLVYNNMAVGVLSAMFGKGYEVAAYSKIVPYLPWINEYIKVQMCSICWRQNITEKCGNQSPEKKN